MSDRRGFLKGAAGAGAALATGPALAASVDWRLRARAVKAEMAFAWNGYAERCFGADQIQPVSGQGESFFFEKGPSVGLAIEEALATDLADRLLPAFKTRTGLPYRFVNLKTGAGRDGVTYPAEFGTWIAEFGTLSRLTGDRRYYDLAKAAAKAGCERR